MEVTLRPFFSGFRSQNFKRGEIVVRAGGATDYLYYVKSGFVRQYSINSAGQELTVYIYPPDSCFFLPWMFNVTKNHYYFQTMTRATIRKALKSEFLQKIQTNIPALFLLAGSGYVGLTVLMMHMETMLAGESPQKVASVLAVLTRWFGKKTGRKILVNFPTTHQFISTVSGLSKETVNRILKELKDKKILEIAKGKIYISHVEKLNKMTSISYEGIPVIPTVTD